MPTFVLFRNGEKIGDLVGADPKSLEVGAIYFFTLQRKLTSSAGTHTESLRRPIYCNIATQLPCFIFCN